MISKVKFLFLVRVQRLKAIAKRLRSAWILAPMSSESLLNLEELRSYLVERLALILLGANLLALGRVLAMPRLALPISLLSTLVILTVLTAVVAYFARSRPRFSRHLFVWAITLLLLVSPWFLYDPWFLSLGLLLIFVGALLVPGSEFAVAAFIATMAFWLTLSGNSRYSLSILLITLGLGVIFAWSAAQVLYLTLHQTWQAQQRADRLLNEVREHRVELSRLLKSVENSNLLLRNTQQELIFARQQAEQARYLKEQFAANVSHELRTPLNIILGFSELMHFSPEIYDEERWTPSLRRDVGHIYRNSRHLSEMIDDILELSRFGIARFALRKDPIPIESLLREVVGIAENFFVGTSVRLETALDEDLPILEGDSTRIRQVLLNLLKNAQRFTQVGTVCLSARQTENNEVEISVRDTGPGIPESKLPHIFEEFYQADLSLQRSHSGVGLGLAISKQFVEAHGGCIWVKSQLGKGTTFFFTLPISSSLLPLKPVLNGRNQEQLIEQTRPPVLVVSPEAMSSALLEYGLSEYTIIHVADMHELAEAAAFYLPRAVIAPPSIAQRLRQYALLPGSVPVIESVLPTITEFTQSQSVKAYLTKPIRRQQLMDQIERLQPVQDVLLVDQNRGFCQLLKAMFEASPWDCRVRSVYTGQDSLRMMEEERPDLLILDLNLPDMSSLEVLEQMRRKPSLTDIPIILVSATNFVEENLIEQQGILSVSSRNGLTREQLFSCLRAVLSGLSPAQFESRNRSGNHP